MVVKTLMEDMRVLDPGDEQYAAKFPVVMESVRQHITEEEGERFPRAQEELADEMVERKQELHASSTAPSRVAPGCRRTRAGALSTLSYWRTTVSK